MLRALFTPLFLAAVPFDRREEFGLIVTVEMDLVGVAVLVVVALEALADDVRFTGDGAERGDPIVVTHQLVSHSARFDRARPANEARHTEGAFPVSILLGAKRRHRAVRPGIHVRTVVGAVDDDRVVGDAHVIECLEQSSRRFHRARSCRRCIRYRRVYSGRDAPA